MIIDRSVESDRLKKNIPCALVTTYPPLTYSKTHERIPEYKFTITRSICTYLLLNLFHSPIVIDYYALDNIGLVIDIYYCAWIVFFQSITPNAPVGNHAIKCSQYLQQGLVSLILFPDHAISSMFTRVFVFNFFHFL